MAENPTKMTVNETRLRSFVKSVIYRLISIVGTAVLTWLITRDIGKTASITVLNQLFLIFLYFSSERTWNKIHWGRNAHVP